MIPDELLATGSLAVLKESTLRLLFPYGILGYHVHARADRDAFYPPEEFFVKCDTEWASSFPSGVCYHVPQRTFKGIADLLCSERRDGTQDVKLQVCSEMHLRSHGIEPPDVQHTRQPFHSTPGRSKASSIPRPSSSR